MNRKVNNKVHIDKTKWYMVKPSIVERVKEVFTMLFLISVCLTWLIIANV